MRAASLSLLVLVLGCTTTSSGGGDDVQSVESKLPRGTGTLFVQNDSKDVIYRVLLAEASDAEWGPDRLDGAEVLKPGKGRGFEVAEGVYLVQVEFKGGRIHEDEEHYTVRTDEEATCTIRETEDDQLGTVTIVNRTGFAIARLFLSSTDQMGWGEDRLDAEQVLPPRKKLSLKLPAGNYNLKVEFQDGTSLEGDGAYEVVSGQVAVYRLGRQ